MVCGLPNIRLHILAALVSLPLTRMHPTFALMQPLKAAKTIVFSLLATECFPGESLCSPSLRASLDVCRSS